MSFLLPRYALLFPALLAVGLGAACTTTTIVPAPAAADAEAPPPAEEVDAGAVDSSVVADATVAPIGTLVLKGDVSVPGDLGAGPSCGVMCGKIFGTCDSNNSGESSYTCPNGTNSGRNYDCGRAPSAKTPSGCVLTSYSCACHDVPLANPYVAVEQEDLPVTCSAACASHGRTCDTSKPSAQYQKPLLSGGMATLGCDDAPNTSAKSLRCYCR